MRYWTCAKLLPCCTAWYAPVLNVDKQPCYNTPEDHYWSAKIVSLLRLMRNIPVLLLHTDLAMAMRSIICKALRKLAPNASLMPVIMPAQSCLWYPLKVCSPDDLVFSTYVAFLLHNEPMRKLSKSSHQGTCHFQLYASNTLKFRSKSEQWSALTVCGLSPQRYKW